eukprot:gene13882-biopygen11104
MQDIIPDAVQEWHAEDVIFEAFWRIFSAFWTTKLAKNGLKDALQRRGYLRSLPMGPIDGRKKPFRMRSAPESRQGYPPFSLTVEIRKQNAGDHAECRPGMHTEEKFCGRIDTPSMAKGVMGGTRGVPTKNWYVEFLRQRQLDHLAGRKMRF